MAVTVQSALKWASYSAMSVAVFFLVNSVIGMARGAIDVSDLLIGGCFPAVFFAGLGAAASGLSRLRFEENSSPFMVLVRPVFLVSAFIISLLSLRILMFFFGF